MTDDRFDRLARRRVKQGFNAVQLVAGVPPEVGPENPNAASAAGFPWRLNGAINHDYIRHARDRIRFLNHLGLRVIVYGGWGQQIEWIGPERMTAWWRALVEALDDCDVIYCLTGELTLWLTRPKRLLPDLSTDDLVGSGTIRSLFRRLPRIAGVPRAVYRRYVRFRFRSARVAKWSAVFDAVNGLTRRPWIVHPVSSETGMQALRQGDRLAAETTQTGHAEEARTHLHRRPLDHHGTVPIINLEPWYEGIGDRFYAEDQWYAFLASRMSGAAGHCYGAHGIWNCGDGRFLAHWGRQTFEQAEQLSSPWLLGSANRFLEEWFAACTEPSRTVKYDRILRYIELTCANRKLTWYADPNTKDGVCGGNVWTPDGIFDLTPLNRMPLVYHTL